MEDPACQISSSVEVTDQQRKDNADLASANGETEASNEEHTSQGSAQRPQEYASCVEQHETKEAEIRQKYLRKFRTAVVVVQVIRNLIKMYRDYAASRAKLLSFAEFGASTETDTLLFDLSSFKAKKQSVISTEAQLILSSPPRSRTSEGVKLAMLSLRATVDAFARYPVLIQQELAKVGWYECFGPGRVIIRQGHVPQNFYLILSGTAVVTKVTLNKQTGELFPKTVAFLKKGTYFGDVAILTSAKRNATVVCHDNVSMLAVSREDFLSIFLNNESREGPDFIKFLHKIQIFSGWPIEKLPYSNPRICVHTFFRPGTVITKDSKASSKIYVIKSGAVRVLKAMTPSKPQLPFKSLKFTRLHQQPFVEEELEPKNKAMESNSETNVASHSFSEEEHLLPILQRNKLSNVQPQLSAPVNDSGEAPSRLTAKSRMLEEDGESQIYIHIQTLRSGDVFGLAYAVYDDTPSMALVSDGAECILISKEFFKKNTDEAYLSRLSTKVQPYPSKEMLENKMQDYINWKAYKTLLINSPH
ncbi:cyclic nucleotide-binding domain-containing protein 2-like [Pleurodeles waltl]|uniref:cyclic nucleotide-binding domain-containing protein 2-like n=1 Tax=Pleurodeles waltl TaxID=8319 RepID=UPI0037094C3D